MFSELVRRSRRITRDEFATTFGDIADDVVEMLDSEQARQITREAREAMESSGALSGGRPRLQQVEFGLFGGDKRTHFSIDPDFMEVTSNVKTT